MSSIRDANINIVYKINKYNSKMNNQNNKLVYQKKYVFYVNQLGGSGALSLGLRLALCARHAAITTAEANASKLQSLPQNQLVNNASNRLKNITKELQQRFRSNVRESAVKGELTLDIPDTEYEKIVMEYVQKPECGISHIGINANDNDSVVAQKIFEQVDKLANMVNTQVSKISLPTKLTAPLTPEQLSRLYAINI